MIASKVFTVTNTIKNDCLSRDIKKLKECSLDKKILGGYYSLEIFVKELNRYESYLYNRIEDRDYDFNEVLNLITKNNTHGIL
jgi:hypothetical protein